MKFELRGVQQHDLTQAAWCSDDRTELNDTRTSVVGAGAAVVAGSLWAPWYAIDFISVIAVTRPP